jgi:hypothetical protein
MKAIAIEKTASTFEAVAADRVRLHIAPFNETLLKTYISSLTLPSASNISYHTLETFPEKAYGYIELPDMEAQKLKKKFNGTILKGTKVRVENARPEKRKAVPEDIVSVEDTEKSKKRARRARKEKGEVAGVVLPEGRSVKRGWTETPSEKGKEKSKEGKRDKKDKKEDAKRKREPSKYTNDAECLFRVEVPPNVASQADEKKKKKKKSKGEQGVVVHEFEQTQKHASFLKSGKVDKDTKMSAEYVEGKGWVDADGEMIEAETDAQREKRERKERKQAKKAMKLDKKAELEREAVVDTSADSEGESSKKKRKTPKYENESTRKSEAEPAYISSIDEALEASTASEPKTSINDTTDQDAPSPPREIHPLEALFKRPKPASGEPSPTKLAPIQTSFSFFSSAPSDNENDESLSPGDVDDIVMTTMNAPQTPFTKQDMEWRRQRSPAPTPDTAAINRKFSFSMMKIGEDYDTDDENEKENDAMVSAEKDFTANGGLGITNVVDESGKSKAGGDEKEESEFSKWFWENRGDTNRAWKRRRREAMKMKRKRENRRLNRRVV